MREQVHHATQTCLDQSAPRHLACNYFALRDRVAVNTKRGLIQTHVLAISFVPLLHHCCVL